MLYHKPVLLHQCVQWLVGEKDGTYVDATYGGGGHSKAILQQLDSKGRLFSFDRDADAELNKDDDPRLALIRSDFKFIEKELRERGVEKVNGILADLGISSHQVDTAARGFSFRNESTLDMRMDQRQPLTAQEVVNSYDEEDLIRILSAYGELPNARRAARAIIMARMRNPLLTTIELAATLETCIPRGTKPSKYLSMAFQAIRIEVNGEMESLEALLSGGMRLLAPGGRFVILSYHSLEDRKVKNFFRSGNLKGKEEKDFFGNSLSPFTLPLRKAGQPDEQEIEENPRARSARLRVAEKRR
jgi:16S rRNA (cytosine1402-N4)-methyltransferase